MRSIYRMALVTGLIFVFDETKLQAQYQASKYEFGVNLGTLVYQGDLTPGNTGNYRSLKPALALSVSRLLTSHLALSVNLVLGKLAEDEARYVDPSWRRDRSFSFTTRMTELSGMAVWNFATTDDYHQPRFIPYAFAGAGLTLLHTRKDWSKVNDLVYGEGSQVQTGLAIDSMAPARRVAGVLPIGVGLKYRFTPQMLFNTAVTYRFTASDYIDGFKYAGNAAKKDGYYGFSVGILYSFGKYKCPPVK